MAAILCSQMIMAKTDTSRDHLARQHRAIAHSDRRGRVMTTKTDYKAAFLEFEQHVCDIVLMARVTLDSVNNVANHRTTATNDDAEEAIFTARHTLRLAEEAKEEWYRLHKDVTEVAS
jgi:hypothetical protein